MSRPGHYIRRMSDNKKPEAAGEKAGIKRRKSAVFPVILLLLVLVFIVLLIWGLSLPPRASVKIITNLPLSSAGAWDLIAENDSQVFWRTNLINIVNIGKTNGRDRWREIYDDDSETVYEVSEYQPGKKIVKNYPARSGRMEQFTIIVQAEPSGSAAAFIETVGVPNPFTRILLKTGLVRKKDYFRRLNDYVGQLGAELRRRGIVFDAPAPSQAASTPTNIK